MNRSLRRAPLVESICERLLAEHRATDWLPPERQLAFELGVSRPALREAIKRLENQGLLAARHGVGVQVVDRPEVPIQAVLERTLPSPAERVRQFTAARQLVEPELAALAATRLPPNAADRLAAIHERFCTATDLDAALAADLEFHRALASLSGNRVLELMIASMAPLETDSRRITLGQVGLAEARRQHGRILSAVLAQNPAAARRAMQTHLRAAAASLRT